jgi:hypothetical protein
MPVKKRSDWVSFCLTGMAWYGLSKGTGKSKGVLCFLTQHNTMKAYWGVEVYLHALTSALDGGEWSAAGPGRFIPR